MGVTVARVSGGRDHDYACSGGIFSSPGQRIFQIASLVVAAGRYVHDPDVELLTVSDNPVQPECNVLVSNARGRTDLDQNEIGFRCDSTIESSGKESVTGADDRGHHP